MQEQDAHANALELAEEQELLLVLGIDNLDPMQVAVYEKQLQQELDLMRAAAIQASVTGEEVFQQVEASLARLPARVEQLHCQIAGSLPASRQAERALSALQMSSRHTFAVNQQVAPSSQTQTSLRV